MLGWLAGSGQALAGTRDTALILAFRTNCASERPDFAHIDQRATAAGLQLLRTIDKPPVDGMFLRQKLWLVAEQSGQVALMAIEGNGPDGYLSGCGIVSPDLNAEGFKPALAAAFRLGTPTSEKNTPVQGLAMRLTQWAGVFGPGTALQLMQGAQGAGLDYVVKGPRRQ